MIGIMELTDEVLWLRCDCPIHRAGRRRVRFGLMYGMSRNRLLRLAAELLKEDRGQDIAEYALLVAVIIVIVVGVVHLVGARSGEVFSQIGSKLQ